MDGYSNYSYNENPDNVEKGRKSTTPTFDNTNVTPDTIVRSGMANQ